MSGITFTRKELDELRRTPNREHRRLLGRYDRPLVDKGALERVRPQVYALTPLGRTVRAAAVLSFDQGHEAGATEERRKAIENFAEKIEREASELESAE